MQEDIPLGLPTPCTPATHSCGQSSNSFQPQQEQTSWLRMLWSSLIFECWRAASGEYGPIPCVMTGRTQAELKVPWVLKPERGVRGRGGQSWRGLGGVLKIFTGHQEKSGGCINAFPTLSHTNHETTWNVSPTHMFPLSFTSSLFFFFFFLWLFSCSVVFQVTPCADLLLPHPPFPFWYLSIAELTLWFVGLSHLWNAASSGSELNSPNLLCVITGY